MGDDIVFYTNPFSRGGIVQWMLEEVGVPYKTEILEYGTTMKGAGLSGVQSDGQGAGHHVIVTEAAAICAYLADAFPDAGLAPPSAERGAYYRWLFFGAGPVEAALSNRACGFQPTLRPGDAGGLWLTRGGGRYAGQGGGGSTVHCQRAFHRRGRLHRRADRLGHAFRVAGESPGVRGLLGLKDRPAHRRVEALFDEAMAERMGAED